MLNKEQRVLEKLRYFVYPANPLDSRALSRVKRGMIHYAHTGGWSAIPRLQRWIRRHSFEFRHGTNGFCTRLKVSADDLTHLWVADEVLTEHVYSLNAVPFTPDLVLDLGANIGLFTLLAAQRWPNSHLVCVEPHPLTFDQLCKNLAANRVSAMRLQCAIADTTGIQFLCNEGAVFQALTEAENATPTLTMPLDALLPRAAKNVLIKMDIEGAEQAALENARLLLPEQCFIFIEIHQGDESLAWMRRWASSHGFAFTEVRRREEAIDGYLSRTGATA
jgi:FkbM family methyltransferase